MTFGKPRIGLLAVTLVTVMAVVSVVGIYAVLIGTYQGGEVTVGGTGAGNVMYSSDNAEAGSWSTTLTPSDASASWYSRLDISSGDYSGPVTVTWQLQQKTGSSTWTNVSGATTSTSIVLSGSAQNVYTTSNGVWASNNRDWGTDVTAAGTYRVVATVESA